MNNQQATSPTQNRPTKRTRTWSSKLKKYTLLTLVVAAVLWFTYQFVEPAPPRKLTIATGSQQGAYYQFAKQLQSEFALEGIDLILLETEGSVENLEHLADGGDAQVAFLQSGIANAARHSAIEGLASLYFEPLWVFSNHSKRLQRVGDLTGLRIAVGPARSGTRQVMTQLLADNGLDENHLTLLPLAGLAAVDALIDGTIDVVTTISAEHAVTVKQLLGKNHPGIKLMSFERADAYARRYPYFSSVSLPEGVIEFDLNIPASRIQLVTTAATLVVRNDLHPALSDLLMQAAGRVFKRDTLFSSAGQFPSPEFLDFQLNPEAERYFKYGVPFLQRFLPFWAANLIDRLKLLALPLIALFLPLSKILPPAYRWSVRKKIYHWYDEVQLIDQSAFDNTDDENLHNCLQQLARIESDARDVDVPLGYAHELYALRQHIDLLKQQISSARIKST